MRPGDIIKTQTVSDQNLSKLLLKCVVSDGEAFLKAFAEWEKQIVYNELDFQSFHLLSAIYPKLCQYKINSHLALRIKSAYRRTWTENQLLLTHLKNLLTVLKAANIEFVIADEAIRLTEIYHDLGLFSLQNFSIILPISRKKEFCQKLSKNLWEICQEGIEETRIRIGKSFYVQALWISDKEFVAEFQTAENILIKEILYPVLCPERQLLNLCANEFLIFDNENNRRQFIAAELFKAQKINPEKLILLTEKLDLAPQLAKMLQKLVDDFETRLPDNLINELRNISQNGRMFLVKQKIKKMRQSYHIYFNYQKQSKSKISLLEFLKKRWKVNSGKVLIRHAIESCMRLVRAK
jgi:hypothetical protein